jgi:EAL domain-containing protein (putative c-di-GMP-specific phosphodiesterase class I)/DNA-binding response OmpR family regulator
MRKVLIIEDEDDIRDALVRILKVENYQVIEAENGYNGVELALQHLPDLVICDISMPKLDGFGVLNVLRTHSETTNIPFIFLTARTDKASQRQGMNQGADDFLTKPFTIKEVLGAVNARLVRHALNNEKIALKLQESTRRINYLEQHDPLTNLPNRVFLEARFNEITNAPYYNLVLMLVNLKRVNLVYNDLGYNVGDRLLVLAIERIRQFLPGNIVMAWLPSAQLCLLVDDSSDLSNVLQLTQESLRLPFEVDGYRIYLDPVIGSANCQTDDSLSIDELLKRANLAVSLAMKQGGNYHHFTVAEINKNNRFHQQILLETAMYRALEREEFQLYYQPQVDPYSGRIVGAEALIRWLHPELGLVSPSSFIRQAEDSGAIVPLGEWVLKTACAQARKWQLEGWESLRISVNCSPVQLVQTDLDKLVNRTLKETSLEPTSLEIELTEGAFLNDFEMAKTAFDKLKYSGVRISLDDFGTGFSSLTYLQHLPFSSLKIDRSFVSNLHRNTGNAAIVSSVIQLAHSLNLQVVAEGVEQEEELCYLKQLGCNLVQGYLIARPLTTGQFEQFLKKACKAVI